MRDLHQITSYSSNFKNQEACQLMEIPDYCPLCHRGINILPNSFNTAVFRENKTVVEVVFQCPIISCSHLFIGRYKRDRNSGYFSHEASLPLIPNLPCISDEIKDLSPNFCKIYSEPLVAKQYSLTELVGIGLRKALEYLIKDFCIHKHPEKETEIKEAWLKNCIDNYCSDTRLKECAHRATWIGNDETHYVKIWECKDVTDLEKLIKITMSYIEQEILADTYINEMNLKKLNTSKKHENY